MHRTAGNEGAIAEMPALVSGATVGAGAAPAGTTLVETLVDALRTARLTVLTGAAGSGKTTLLHEALRPLLRRRSEDQATRATPTADLTTGGGIDLLERRRRRERPRELVVWCDRWDGSLADRLHACLDAAAGLPTADAGLSRAPVALRAEALGAERGARVLFVFDRGDRFPPESPADPGPAAEYDMLLDTLCGAGPAVHLLVSARDDALPPALRARVERGEARVLRLPDRRGPAAPRDGVPGVPIRSVVPAPTSPGASVERPLQREEVYESIIARLTEIGAGTHEAPWGGVVTTAAGDPSAARGAGAPKPGGAGRGQPNTGLPGRWSGGVAEWMRRVATPQAASVRLVGMGLVAAVAVGVLLWQDRSHPVRRLATVATGPGDAEVAIGRGALTDRPVVALGRSAPAPLSSSVTAPDIPASGAAAPVPVPVSPVIDIPSSAAVAPSLATAGAATSPARLADELWRGLSTHGLQEPRPQAGADPLQALSTGQRLVIVPYDALQRIAAAPATARSARVVAPLFAEELQVIVRADSPLRFIHEIVGRRVNVGPTGSQRQQSAAAFYRQLFDAPLAPTLASTDELAPAVRELLGRAGVDAIILPEAQPSAWLARLPEAERRGLRFLRLAPEAPSTRRALRTYLPATLHAGPGSARGETPTLGAMTFLVWNGPASEGGATAAAQAFCQALPALRRDGHPKWREVDPTLRLPVPLATDPGAAAVFDACMLGPDAAAPLPSLRLSRADPYNRGAHE